MGFLDRLLGRDADPAPRGTQRSDDELAVERYRYLLRTAPPDTIERAHAEAFSRLTPKQREILFDRLTAHAATSTERPVDAQPATLAQAATRAELQQPGALQRTLGGSAFGGAGMGGPSFGGMVGSSLLGSVAGYVIGSALVSGFLPPEPGDASADQAQDGVVRDGAAQDGDPGQDPGAADASAVDHGDGDLGDGFDGGWGDGGGFEL